MRIFALLTALTILSACSNQAMPAHASNIFDGQDEYGQNWKLSLGETIREGDLPATSDMRLVNFNASEYVKLKCLRYFREESCQVFAQTDPNGSLNGYLILYGNGNSYRADSDTRTTPAGPTSIECVISGEVEVREGDPVSDFLGHITFTNKLDATGLFYLKRIGNRLKIEDERWNYCYEDRHIDDVYTLIGTITREIDESRWPAGLPR